MESDQVQFERALLCMDRIHSRTLMEAALAQGGLGGVEALVSPALNHIGDRWEAGELALTQVYMAGRICEDLLGEVAPAHPAPAAGGPVIGVGTLLDQHQLGKRIVLAALRAGGFQVLDYGQGLDPRELAAAALRDQVPILMVSVLMAASARRVAELREALGEAPDRPRLVVGGAPFRLDPALGGAVKADAVGHTGLDAVQIAQRILEQTCAL